MNPPIDLDDWRGVLHQAISATRAGRRVLLDYFGRLSSVESKFQAGLVSEADRDSEAAIIRVLKGVYPQSEFLAEEAFYLGEKLPLEKGSAGHFRWILDPLDGTTNYVHRFPIFCISLGLEVSGVMQVAVIDVPLLNETYTAIRNQGAFVNGRPLCVSKTGKISDSLLSTGFFPDDKGSLPDQLKKFTHLISEARAIRRPGAAAYDLCMVAAGVFDGFWEQNLKPWDTAAGQLLVEEAGGQVVTYEGKPHSPYEKSIIAGNSTIVQEIQRRIHKP